MLEDWVKYQNAGFNNIIPIFPFSIIPVIDCLEAGLNNNNRSKG